MFLANILSSRFFDNTVSYSVRNHINESETQNKSTRACNEFSGCFQDAVQYLLAFSYTCLIVSLLAKKLLLLEMEIFCEYNRLWCYLI